MKKFKFGKGVDEKIKELVKKLPANAKVLDLGSGLGGNGIFLANQGFEVTCLDKDKEVIEILRKEHPEINALYKDILEFDFPKNEYDFVIARAILNFFRLRDIKIIIDKVIKSLKENGLFYLMLVSDKNRGPNKRLDRHFFNKEELKEIFKENKILEIKEMTFTENHPPRGEHSHDIIKMVVEK